MNSKTTLLLAALLAGLVLGYFGLRRQLPARSAASNTPSAQTEQGLTRDLLAEPLGNVVKIVAKRSGDEWVFEKKTPAEGGAAVWQMTKPVEAKVLSHEVDRIAREAGKIQYEVSYKSGDGAISAQDAGLSPPASTITLTDDAGKSATIEIGKPVSEHETYARKAGDETIVVAKSNLRKLLKAKPLEYRDLQLWNFVPEQATHIEVCETTTERAADCQYLIREGGQWRFDRPVTAKATPKVDEMLKAVSRLRVSQWHDDDPAKLQLYGLEPGTLQINVTVEEPIPAAKADVDKPAIDAPEAEGPPATEKRTRIYKLQVADRGPIGEDTKVFVRSGDDTAIATIFKSAADKFKPVMSEWRDMQVVASNVTNATRIEMNVNGETAALVQKEGQWVYESDNTPAESHAVTEFLAAIKGLKAISFVEAADTSSTPSFDSPQADIRLTVPGTDGVERITVGGYTDPAKKLLVYVRGGDIGPIAKVKASEIATLTKPPTSLRDRTIFNFQPGEVTRIEITRPNEWVPATPQHFTLEKENGLWTMTSPTTAAVRADEAERLANSLSSLKAESIVGQENEASAFGLHEPAVRVSFTVAPARETPEGAIPASEFKLAVARHDGKIFGYRGDGGPVYELNKAFYEQLQAEFRTAEGIEFEPKDIKRVTLKSGEESNSYLRKNEKWVFESEPDLAVDTAKIDKILTEIKAIKPDRFAAYSSEQIDAYGLAPAQFELNLEDPNASDQKSITLQASEKTVSHQSPPPASPPGGPPPAPASTTAHFAVLSDREGVFLLDSAAAKKIFLPLAELEKK